MLKKDWTCLEHVSAFFHSLINMKYPTVLYILSKCRLVNILFCHKNYDKFIFFSTTNLHIFVIMLATSEPCNYE